MTTATYPFRVVLVEDDEDTCELISTYLCNKFPDLTLDIARDGVDGLRIIEKVNPGVVFLDICVPIVSGIEIAKSLRSNPKYSNTVLAACTGRCDTKSFREIADSGFDFFISKPFELEYLDETVVARRQPKLVLMCKDMTEWSRRLQIEGRQFFERVQARERSSELVLGHNRLA